MGTRVLIVVLFVLSVLTSSALTYLLISKTNVSGNNSTASASDDIGEQVAKFIQENPNVIIDSLRRAQQARAEQEEQQAGLKAAELRPQLENGKNDPTAGNKEGDVTIVAFHDHNCGFCRKSIPDIEKILSEDSNVKFVVKDFPILGPVSVEKARASVAIARFAPEKWYKFYEELGRSNAQNLEQILALASEKVGIDANLLRSEMESNETENKISENHSLGEQLGISGTPVFVINGQVLRGALGYDAFKAAVLQARADLKK
jgi:protein-disulfide isomerase